MYRASHAIGPDIQSRDRSPDLFLTARLPAGKKDKLVQAAPFILDGWDLLAGEIKSNKFVTQMVSGFCHFRKL